LKKIIFIFIIGISIQTEIFPSPKICFTLDDPNTNTTPLLSWEQRNERILNILKKHNLKIALFVCGKRIDNENGMKLLSMWDSENHLICNHTYSHYYYNSSKAVKEQYWADILKDDSLINGYKNYTKLFRYPFLKEGATKENRDYIRNNLKMKKYRIGYVSIDASDWYIDEQMIKALKTDTNTNINPYKDYYLQHLLDRARYYNNLALKLTGREIKHTLLLHHSLLNALFLDSVINAFKNNGWEIIDADEAYKDEIYNEEPDNIPSGESIIWALAKQSGKFERELRYPAEDAEYEEKSLNEFIKNYIKK
jgi:peptidoglycan-N-acetylglucosamine deacetylase